MAMRDQWTELYGPAMMGPAMSRPSSSLADSTAVTTSGTSYVGTVNSPSSPSGIEGRIGKSVKRRSRASRRAPVTLLNTDTNNFRAMVQQFTGIPSGPYSSGGLQGGTGGPGGPGINFGLDFNGGRSPNGGVMQFGHMQQQQYHRPSFQEQTYTSQMQQQQQQYQYGGNMFAPEEYNNNGGNDVFSHGFGNEGVFLDGPAGRMMSKTTSVVNNRSGEYFG